MSRSSSKNKPLTKDKLVEIVVEFALANNLVPDLLDFLLKTVNKEITTTTNLKFIQNNLRQPSLDTIEGARKCYTEYQNKRTEYQDTPNNEEKITSPRDSISVWINGAISTIFINGKSYKDRNCTLPETIHLLQRWGIIALSDYQHKNPTDPRVTQLLKDLVNATVENQWYTDEIIPANELTSSAAITYTQLAQKKIKPTNAKNQAMLDPQTTLDELQKSDYNANMAEYWNKAIDRGLKRRQHRNPEKVMKTKTAFMEYKTPHTINPLKRVARILTQTTSPTPLTCPEELKQRFKLNAAEIAVLYNPETKNPSLLLSIEDKLRATHTNDKKLQWLKLRTFAYIDYKFLEMQLQEKRCEYQGAITKYKATLLTTSINPITEKDISSLREKESSTESTDSMSTVSLTTTDDTPENIPYKETQNHTEPNEPKTISRFKQLQTFNRFSKPGKLRRELARQELELKNFSAMIKLLEKTHIPEEQVFWQDIIAAQPHSLNKAIMNTSAKSACKQLINPRPKSTRKPQNKAKYLLKQKPIFAKPNDANLKNVLTTDDQQIINNDNPFIAQLIMIRDKLMSSHLAQPKNQKNQHANSRLSTIAYLDFMIYHHQLQKALERYENSTKNKDCRTSLTAEIAQFEAIIKILTWLKKTQPAEKPKSTTAELTSALSTLAPSPSTDRAKQWRPRPGLLFARRITPAAKKPPVTPLPGDSYNNPPVVLTMRLSCEPPPQPTM